MMDLLMRGPIGLLADFFSLITILMCLVAKIPQIRTLHSLKSAKGISPIGLYLETLSYTIMMSYNYCSGYSLLSYLEYPVLLVQNYALLYLVFDYKRMLQKNTYLMVGGYFVVTLLVLRFMPAAVLALFVPLCMPVGALSKLMVLVEIVRTRDSTTVNLTTWFISAFTNLTRVFTIYVESGDQVLLFNFYVSVLLSSSVWLAAYVFKKSNKSH